ncbi:hypothetical protein ENUP19_0198G0017 [Entamoeba nuttalli]|uniref:Ubiquitin-like domain-containing protein n=1 Tax=Entamoeba nuttalli TaxID=412467 RepID=A0ABQ0DNE2_9EUKA
MVKILYKGNTYTVETELTKQVRELRFDIEKVVGLKACRQRLWYQKGEEKVVLEVDKTLQESGVTEDTPIEMKDLGAQLPFRFVYICEYVGPLALYVLIYLISLLAGYPSLLQNKLAVIMWVIHYIKRIVETIYVHEFGDMTMPVFNLYKNCTYYYGFAIAVAINVNFFPRENCSILIILGLIGMIVSIISNGYCHLLLKQLRTPGSQEWKMPHGFLFEYITCANYFCEIMTWIFFNVMTGFSLFGIAFSCCGIYQMREWAYQRHQKYLHMFPDYPKRWILIPFIY